MMPNLPKGTVVKTIECGCCGRDVAVKLNKNGMGYYYCNGLTAEGEFCSHHERWGRAESQKMQREYLAARPTKGGTDDTPPDQYDTAKRSTAGGFLGFGG